MPKKQRIMITNPFIINGDIPSEYFCDRKNESKRLIQMLTNGENVCLMSPRRMGKSKLIQFCYDQEPLCSDYYCFYIDIFHTTSLREFTYTFGRQIFSALRSKSQKMTLWFVQALKSLSADFGFDPSTGMPTFSLSLGDVHNPEFTLEEFFKALEQADKPCIVCFDEFQQIVNYPEKKHRSPVTRPYPTSRQCQLHLLGQFKALAHADVLFLCPTFLQKHLHPYTRCHRP